MYRALVQLTDGGRATLPEEEIHHLIRVRRCRSGDTFLGLDGCGTDYLCALERGPEGWYGRVLETRPSSAPVGPELTLGQSLLKKDRFDWVLQKATELGVSRVIPLVSGRTELRLPGEREKRRRVRWERILQEAVKQCGRSRVPVLEKPIPLPDLLERKNFDLVLALDEEGETSLGSYLEERREADSCLVLVGPEGGWNADDRAAFQGHGIPGIRMGPRILRAETAPLAALSILQYRLGDFST